MADTATLQLMVDEANQAVRDLMTRGQEVRVNNRTFRRAELDQLMEVRNQLERELARSVRGGLRVGQLVPRG